MTAIREEGLGFRGSQRATQVLVGIVFAVLGIAIGVGIGQAFDVGTGSESIYEGPLVERSLAMDGNINTLIESGRAQARNLGLASAAWSGPFVERSLAMERNTQALVEGGHAQQSALADSQASGGALVERSLAMQENLNALIEGGRAMAKALGR